MEGFLELTQDKLKTTGGANELNRMLRKLFQDMPDASSIPGKAWTEMNILLNAFRIAINGALAKFNLVDGIMDEFEDESGVDTGASTNESYDGTNDLYSPSSGTITIDSYSEANRDGNWNFYTVNGYKQAGQAITLPSDVSITSVKFYLKKAGSPTGNAYAKIYASTGTVGTDAHPTGSALATSDALDVSTLTTSFQLIEFTFSTPYSASAGDICILVDYAGSAAPNYVYVGNDISSPTHSGNSFAQTHVGAPNYSEFTYDACFYLYGTQTNNMTLISQSTTAEAEPDNSRIVLFEEDVDAITINTDLKAYVSRDGGTTYTQTTLSDEGDYASSKRILTGSVDISGQPAGTSMKWKVTTHNNKNLKLHGVGELWN